jgi:hypothetical protein
LAERWFHPKRNADALGGEPEMNIWTPTTVNNWITAKKESIK